MSTKRAAPSESSPARVPVHATDLISRHPQHSRKIHSPAGGPWRCARRPLCVHLVHMTCPSVWTTMTDEGYRELAWLAPCPRRSPNSAMCRTQIHIRIESEHSETHRRAYALRKTAPGTSTAHRDRSDARSFRQRSTSCTLSPRSMPDGPLNHALERVACQPDLTPEVRGRPKVFDQRA